MALPQGHRPQLDGLRTIAVVMVAIYHWFDIRFYGVEPPLGRLGVGLFFVLSGYLITGILLNIREKVGTSGSSLLFAAKSFTMRRIIRLVPALYLYLAVIWLTGYYSDDGWLWYLTYTGNFRIESVGDWPVGVAHLWSLAVEEQFYLVAPIVILFYPRERMKSLLIGSIMAIVFLNSLPASEHSIILPPTAFLGLIFGCVIAIEAFDTSTAPLNQTLQRWALGCSVGYGVLYFLRVKGVLPYQSIVFADFVGYIAMAGIVWAVAVGLDPDRKRARVLMHPWMQHLGRISYGLYLWHFFASYLRANILGFIPRQIDLFEFVIMGSITVALAQLSHWAVERHVNKLKGRFPYIRPVAERVSDPEPATV